MILQCPQCSTQFRLDDSLLLPDGRAVACSKCNHQWFAEPPQPEPSQPEPSQPEPSQTENPPQPESAPPQNTPPTPEPQPKSTPIPTTPVSSERGDGDLSPLEGDTGKPDFAPDFAMEDDIADRLARIRESVQPKSDTVQTPSQTPTQPDIPPQPTLTEATPEDAYKTVDDYGLNDGAVFEKTPETPTQESPENIQNDGLEKPTPQSLSQSPPQSPPQPTEEPVVKDIQNFETALSKASQLAEMAELKDNPVQYRDATTGEPITSPIDADEPESDSKTAKAQNAILQAVRNKKDSFKAKKEERPSHVQRNERSWFTQIIILLCVLLGLGALSLLVAKDRVMEMFPETRPYYALIGAKVSSVGKGLVILEPTASITEKNGIKKLVITGTVENRLDTTEPLPTLLAQVKGTDGEVLVQWSFKGKQKTIPPKGKVTYTTSITDPSAKANSVAVTIANMKKEDAKTAPKAGNTLQSNAKKISNAPKVTPVKKEAKKDTEKKNQ